MKQVFSTLKYTVEAEEINGQYVAWIIAEYVNKVLPEYNDTQKRLVCKRSEGGYFLGTDLAMAVLFDEKDHAFSVGNMQIHEHVGKMEFI